MLMFLCKDLHVFLCKFLTLHEVVCLKKVNVYFQKLNLKIETIDVVIQNLLTKNLMVQFYNDGIDVGNISVVSHPKNLHLCFFKGEMVRDMVFVGWVVKVIKPTKLHVELFENASLHLCSRLLLRMRYTRLKYLVLYFNVPKEVGVGIHSWFNSIISTLCHPFIYHLFTILIHF